MVNLVLKPVYFLSTSCVNCFLMIFCWFVAVRGQSLKVLLSFAVGGLLGDVFLHLLPEAWTLQEQYSDGQLQLLIL